jgi:eukaryotic-like serine/threonine-protein kinase
MGRQPNNAELRDDDADTGSADSLLQEAAEISEPSSMTSLSLSLLPGEVLAQRFEIERQASSGGMGAIYRGLDRDSGEPVAIKVVVATGLGAAKRFAREARVLSELSHPAIVRYLAQGTTAQGTLFLAMEWLEGEDLAARLRRAPLSVSESLIALRRACEGLAVAHARGIVHRDIKPSNLFLVDRDPGALKVLDFGVARQPDMSRTVTQSGAVLGTVGYMSPEQAIGPRDVDTRADVFALGCVLFECLTGRAAFVGENAVAVLANLLHAVPPRITELRPELDQQLAALVVSMLAKDPNARPTDAAAILQALDDGFRAVPASKPQPARLRLAGLGVGVLAVAGVLSVVSLRAPESPMAGASPALGEITHGSAPSRPTEPVTAAASAAAVEPAHRAKASELAASPARPKLVKPLASASAAARPATVPARARGLIQDVPF